MNEEPQQSHIIIHNQFRFRVTTFSRVNIELNLCLEGHCEFLHILLHFQKVYVSFFFGVVAFDGLTDGLKGVLLVNP